MRLPSFALLFLRFAVAFAQQESIMPGHPAGMTGLTTETPSETRGIYDTPAMDLRARLTASDKNVYPQRSLKPASHSRDTSNTMKMLNKANAFMQWYMVYFPMPFGSYSKETNWLFGLSKYNAFTVKPKNTIDSVTQASSISALAYYTLNTQYKMVLESNIMQHNNKAIWKTDILYTYYPLLFYGVGNDTDLENESTLNTTNVQCYSYYLFKVYKKWYLGPVFDYLNYYQVNLIDGSSTDQQGTTLTEYQGRQTGLGIKLSMEGRNNRLNAKSGVYVDAGFTRYSTALGGRFNYSYFQFDVRYYHTFRKKLTVATQLRTESKRGDVPVQSLAFLGGDYFMRGTYLGRYRDHVALDSQVELRFPIFWIIGGTLFGGLGQVAPAYSKINIGSFHETHGFGLRLQVDRAHDINLRLDISFSKDQSIIIMNFAEAF
ncbi:BamA/TamA family outer membrane protein [Chryseolinea soli]|uniref:Bacterial surface antigen (D15) domain-containing protein n=1 Tax=Chryseolinea soli TaxID=2321403 RepID=A0A385SY11_9BACT|nr:BamA/TamA family outer membrane protein [Chryseolinea soli]AYB35261.1 hypothetical protein D4L85_33825 [Chryseolinea soli]